MGCDIHTMVEVWVDSAERWIAITQQVFPSI